MCFLVATGGSEADELMPKPNTIRCVYKYGCDNVHMSLLNTVQMQHCYNPADLPSFSLRYVQYKDAACKELESLDVVSPTCYYVSCAGAKSHEWFLAQHKYPEARHTVPQRVTRGSSARLAVSSVHNWKSAREELINRLLIDHR